MIDLLYQNENFGGFYSCRKTVFQDFVVPSHIHENSEILLASEGNGNITISGKPYTVYRNQAVLILPNQIHSCDFHNSNGLCLIISNDHIDYFLTATKDKCFENPIIDLSDNEELINNLLSVNEDSRLLSIAYINLFCDLILKKTKLIDSSTPDNQNLLRKLITYLSEHYTENITLKEFANIMNMNEKYLSSTIHSLTNTNFRTLLAQYRIKHARDMMHRLEEHSITDIAYMSGFSSISSFNRIFKQQTGYSPTEYQKKFVNC